MIARPRGFTLFETLLVAVLLGLLASMGMRGLLESTSSPTHTLRRFAAIDAEARLTARRSGPCTLSLERDEDERLTVLVLTVGERERLFELGAGVEVSGGAMAIAYDRHGQSVDYVVRVPGHLRVLRIAGLTGWSEIDGGE